MTPEERADLITEKYECRNYHECIRPTDQTSRMLAEQIRAAIAEEREACAKEAKTGMHSWEISAAIRART